ncbi:MAG: DHH family phosphoesterase [Candidatus Lokiarchaeota archaeon]|nr:DHH family phosphoesterase [Candidatus Lokiarchaeota archaeon]
MENKSEFLKNVEIASNKIKEWIASGKKIRITSHLDADGISAAGIIGKALLREKAYFHIRIIRQLEKEFVLDLKKENVECFIFTDMGGGQLAILKEELSGKDIIILDHHKPVDPDFDNLIHVNPHKHGIDGTDHISGAGVALFCAIALNEVNKDLAPLAIVGAIGDRQDKGDFNALIGLNRDIIKIGEDLKLLEEKKDLKIFGKETRPIHLALKYTTEPFFPGISGNEDGCLRFLISIKISIKKGNEFRTISELNKEEKRTLVSELLKYGMSHGMDKRNAESIIGMTYILLNEKKGTFLRDVNEFSSLLNSCGRSDKAGLGIAICMGDRDLALLEAEENLSIYRRQLAESLSWFEKEYPITERDYILSFHGGEIIDEKIIGTITSIAAVSKMIKANKPLIGIAFSDNSYSKVSARGNRSLIEAGLDLGEAIRETLKKMNLDEEGGGHNIAAGARIPTKLEEDFLNLLNQTIQSQITKKYS